MRNETIAIHAGYEPEATTHAVAVPIYQTAAYAFDSADHGAALFDAEAAGLAHRPGADDAVHAGVEEGPDIGLQRRCVDLSGGVERRGDGGKDAWEAHALP